MSGDWDIIAPERTRKGDRSTPVKFVLSAENERFQRRITLNFWLDQLTGITWLTPGAAVSIALGRGEFLGRLRISRNGRHKVTKCNGTSGRPSLILPELVTRLVLPAGQRSECVEAHWAPEWIEITLPSWAKLRTADAATVAAVQAAAPDSAPASKGMPFRGVASRTGIGDVAGRPNAPLPLTGGVERRTS
jgi:hypothetical protein